MILEMIGLFEKRAAVMAFEGAFSAVDKRVSLDIRGTGTDVRTIGTTVTGLQGQDMKMGAVFVKAVDRLWLSECLLMSAVLGPMYGQLGQRLLACEDRI